MEAFWVSDLKIATSQLSLEKIIPPSHLERNLSFAIYLSSKRCTALIFRDAIFVVFSAKPSVQRMRSKMVGGLQKTAPCAKIMLDFNLSELCDFLSS